MKQKNVKNKNGIKKTYHYIPVVLFQDSPAFFNIFNTSNILKNRKGKHEMNVHILT